MRAGKPALTAHPTSLHTQGRVTLVESMHPFSLPAGPDAERPRAPSPDAVGSAAAIGSADVGLGPSYRDRDPVHRVHGYSTRAQQLPAKDTWTCACSRRCAIYFHPSQN